MVMVFVMHRLRCILTSLAAVGVVALLPACGSDTTVEVVSTPDTFDPVLQRALVEQNVTPINPPPPQDPALVALGEALFFDKILSGTRTISCGSCHRPGVQTGDALNVSVGVGGLGTAPARQVGTGPLIARNSPPLFNGGLAVQTTMFHDGRITRDPQTGLLQTPIAILNVAVPNPPTTSLQRMILQLDSALAAQACFPVLDRKEMRGEADGGADANELADIPDNNPEGVWNGIIARLVAIPEYVTLFAGAYPTTPVGQLTYGHAAKAIAAWQRENLLAFDSPFDRYVRGELTALSESQKRGALIFFGKTRKGKCANCHLGPLMSDFQFHAIGVPQLGPGRRSPPEPTGEDRGRALVTGDPPVPTATAMAQVGPTGDNYKIRTPSLRNVALTAPYFHDGAFRTLREVVVHYDDIAASLNGYEANFGSRIDPAFGALDTDPVRIAARLLASKNESLLPPTLGLTDREVDDVVAFMESLTDPGAATLDRVQPATVPSGLPVLDPE